MIQWMPQGWTWKGLAFNEWHWIYIIHWDYVMELSLYNIFLAYANLDFGINCRRSDLSALAYNAYIGLEKVIIIEFIILVIILMEK